MFKTFSDICKIQAVSGNEKNIRNYILNKTIKMTEVKEDNFGNLVCYKKGNNPEKTLCVVANMDEPGVIVSGISKDDLIIFKLIGDLSAETLVGRIVEFEKDNKGVVAVKDGINRAEKLTFSDLIIELGVKDSDNETFPAEIGDVGVITETYNITNNIIISRNMKSVVSCVVLLEILDKINTFKNNVYFVFTSEEELGGRGLKVLSNYIDADTVIGVGISNVGIRSNIDGIEMGGGAVLRIKEGSYLYENAVIKKTKNIFKNNNITYQQEISEYFQTNLRLLFNNAKIKNILGVSIPVANKGTGGEIIRKTDLFMLYNAVIAILKEF